VHDSQGPIVAPSAQLLLWPGQGLYLGPVLANDPHAHHAIQISIALEEQLRVRQRVTDPWSLTPASVTAADEEHQLAPCPAAVQLYVDPASLTARAIEHQSDRARREMEIRVGCLAGDLRGLWHRHTAPDRWKEAVDRICASVARPTNVPSSDSRIEHVLELVHAREGQAIRLADAAAAVNLSPSRLSHVFVEQAGLPFRRYLLWIRLINAVALMPTSGSLATAAHRAGFADSAHLTRTFHRMFGMAPSALQRSQVAIHIDPGGWAPRR
jgi:AraC-like DNA-binding protein